MTGTPGVNVNLPGVAASNVKGAEVLRILMPILIVIIIYFIYKKFLTGTLGLIEQPFESAGLMDTKEEKKSKADAVDAVKELEKSKSNPFNPSYYANLAKQGISIKMINQPDADKICKQIKDSIGTFIDSPDETFAAIKKLTSKTQVSIVAMRFDELYNTDLLEFLNIHLDSTAQKIILGKIINYVNKLPIGKL